MQGLQRELESVVTELQALQAARSSAHSNEQEVDQKHAAQEEEIQTLKDQLAAAGDESTHLREQLSEMQAQLVQGAAKHFNELRMIATQTEAGIEENQRRLAAAEEQISVTQAQLASTASANDMMSARLAELNSLAADLRGQLEEGGRASEAEILSLQGQVNEFQQHAASLEEQVRAAGKGSETEMSLLRAQVQEAAEASQAEVVALREQLAQAHIELQKAATQSEQDSAAVSAAKQAVQVCIACYLATTCECSNFSRGYLQSQMFAGCGGKATQGS